MGRKAKNAPSIIGYRVYLKDRNIFVNIEVDEQAKIKDHRQLLLLSQNQKQKRKQRTQKKEAAENNQEKNSDENQENIDIEESFPFSIDDNDLYQNEMNDFNEDQFDLFLDQTNLDDYL